MIIPNLSDLGLPKEFREWRPEQLELLDAALGHKVTLAEAPPGVGKTVVGVGLQKMLNVPIVYITPNKSLQYQLCKTIPYARMVMGRNNYSCLLYPGRTAESCDNSKDAPCSYIDECDYINARAAAEASPMAVLNSTYYLYAANYGKRFRGGALIVDEIDLLERAVLNFVNVVLSERSLLKIEKMGGAAAPMSDDIALWRSWATDTIAVLRKTKMSKEDNAYWSRLSLKLKFLVDNADSSWFMEEDDGRVTFRPVRIAQYVKDLVWQYHTTVLAMSGTVLNPKLVSDDLGLSSYHYVAVDCPFPIANRPIYDLSKYVGDLSASNLVQSLVPMAELIKRIVNGYKNGKVLIHTPSYWLSASLREKLSVDGLHVLSNFSDRDREAALGQFLGGPVPQILISPSFSRGLDLYDSVYNCVIVTKVPWPDLGSEAVSRRLKMPGGQNWYMREAAAGLVQSCSRAVRSMDKQCDIYILDGAYKRLLPLLPKWFKGAVEVR